MKDSKHPLTLTWDSSRSAEDNLPPVFKYQRDHVRYLYSEHCGGKTPFVAYMGYRPHDPECAVTILSCGDTLIIAPEGSWWGRVDQDLKGNPRTLGPDDNETFYPSDDVIKQFADSQQLTMTWIKTPMTEDEAREYGDRIWCTDPDPDTESPVDQDGAAIVGTSQGQHTPRLALRPALSRGQVTDPPVEASRDESRTNWSGQEMESDGPEHNSGGHVL